MTEPTITTTRDIATAFGISIPSATRLAHLPDSPALLVGGTWRWPSIAEVRAWLQARTDAHRVASVVHDHNGP